MDLSLFQFDYNLTWAVFFLNADRTIYGRYGSRKEKSGMGLISLEGFKQALQGALDVHKGYPANKKSLAGKTGPAPAAKTPENYPSLQRYQPSLQADANASRSCMHCHMVHEAQQQAKRSARQPVSDDLIWGYPPPDWLGLSMDPKEKARIQSVAPGSPGEKDGFKAGDEIVTMNGQPIISIADVQWILQTAPEPSKIKVEVNRAGKSQNLDLSLAKSWRRAGDFSWRFFVHEPYFDMEFDDLGAAERKNLGLADTALAIKVIRVGWPVGQPGDAKKAGFQVGDVIVDLDGQSAYLTESQFVSLFYQKKMPGETAAITVLRGKNRQKLQLPISR